MEVRKLLTKKYYISSKAGLSGISKYSNDFFELVLQQNGFIFIDSSENLTTILSRISSRDHVHIEIGIFQKKEIQILFAMLDADYKNVAVTLHDAPLLKFPFYEFKNSLLNKASKFYDLYINRLRHSRFYINRIKTIYALSGKGVDAIKTLYQTENVYFLPHIINETEIKKSDLNNNNFIYIGFIGKNKGLEYSLQLHEKLLEKYPGIHFYIAGKALGEQKIFYNFLKEKYIKNVHFLGYVSEENLDEIFNKATFALLPFNDYKFYSPVSGSILYGLKMGKIVFTTNVNAVSEIIENGKNGFYLSGEIKKDVEIISNILSNKDLLIKMRKETYDRLLQNHISTAVFKKFKE